jgi:hypothetical protein
MGDIEGGEGGEDEIVAREDGGSEECEDGREGGGAERGGGIVESGECEECEGCEGVITWYKKIK